MNAREAAKLKVGDFVIAPKVGIFDPKAIELIITKEIDPKAKGSLPLVNFEENSPDLYTYLLLTKVIVIKRHNYLKKSEDVFLTKDLISEIASDNGRLNYTLVLKFLITGATVHTEFFRYTLKHTGSMRP